MTDQKPVILDKEDFDLIWDKAKEPRPERHRPWQSIMGILAFSKRHHAQALAEIRSIERET